MLISTADKIIESLLRKYCIRLTKVRSQKKAHKWCDFADLWTALQGHGELAMSEDSSGCCKFPLTVNIRRTASRIQTANRRGTLFDRGFCGKTGLHLDFGKGRCPSNGENEIKTVHKCAKTAYLWAFFAMRTFGTAEVMRFTISR